MPRGFVLQPTYRVAGGRPVVEIYGRLEDGGSFLVRDERQVPGFWIPRGLAPRAERLGAATIGPGGRTAMDGTPLVRIEVALPAEVPPLRERLGRIGIPTFEADVRFADRYLIDRGIRGTLRIEGPARSAPGIDALFDNPEVHPADYAPRLSVLSLDIETDPRAARLLSVGLFGCGAAEVLLVRPDALPAPPVPTASCPDERRLLASLCARIRELDPDVITGWNVIDFDLATLARVAARSALPFEIGRGPGRTRIRSAAGRRGPSRAEVPGRMVLDGVQLLRSSYVTFDSYSLDSVARAVLGEGKTISGGDRLAAILDSYDHDPERFVEYNLTDARLVIEILERLRLVDLAVERSRLTGMPLDRVGASIAAFDRLYLSELSRRGIAAPTADPDPADALVSAGGHVLRPRPGLYRHVVVLDFRSLYPSIIRTFQIDPLGLVRGEPAERDSPIVAPNGARFRRAPGILPRMLDGLFPRREAARRAGDEIASRAIKILMNSFYGVLGTRACRFASPELANAITGFGKEILLWTKARIEARGLEVLYGDTDSLFVLTNRDAPAEARALGATLVAELDREIAAHVRDRWGVDSRLRLAFERLYLRLLLPAVRHGRTGARKRYAGLVDEPDGARVVFTGMESVRRDWTPLAKRVQRELYERLFADRPVDTYLRRAVRQLREGELDDLLVYRKALRKRLGDYVASTPPHVAAARKMTRPPGRIVRYVITLDGPAPADRPDAPIDREHYVQRQLRPVAEPVLALLGLDFDRVIGDDTQLRLF